MEIFTIIQENGFSFVSWLENGAALYQHDKGRLMAIEWHPMQELEIDSLLAYPARVTEMTGGSNASHTLTTQQEKFEQAVQWLASDKSSLHFQ